MFQDDNMYLQKEARMRIWMLQNLEHSHRLVQLPSGELNGDVAAQACLNPLMTIPQIVHAINKKCLFRKMGMF